MFTRTDVQLNGLTYRQNTGIGTVNGDVDRHTVV